MLKPATVGKQKHSRRTICVHGRSDDILRVKDEPSCSNLPPHYCAYTGTSTTKIWTSLEAIAVGAIVRTFIDSLAAVFSESA